MAVSSASTGQEVKLKVYSYMLRVFQWVMDIMVATSSSSSLTIGEYNKNTGMCRASAWLVFVFLPSIFIASSVLSAYIMYRKSFWGPGFPWYLPVVMLWGVYMSVLELAMWHLTLFLPQAPYAAREALQHVGLEKIAMAVTLNSAPALFFNLTCMLWSCIVIVLIAAVLAFWFCLVRMYGDSSGSAEAGLARGLALSSLLTAVMVPLFIYIVCWYPQARR